MAERLVSCPACAKPYRLPDGVAIPAGMTFPCRACNAQVPYDAPSSAGSGPAGAATSAPRPAAARGGGGRSAAAPARRGGEAPRAPRRAAAPVAREPDEGPSPEEVAAQKAKAQQNMVLIASISGIVLLVGVIVMFRSLPELHGPQWRSPEEVAAAKALKAKLEAEKPPEVKMPAVAPVTQLAPTTVPAADSPQMKSILSMLMRIDGYNLYRHVDSTSDVTADQRAAMDKDAELVCRRDGGRPADEARTRLLAEGRRAVPSLLTMFVNQWERDKWATDDEKYGNYAVQKLLIDIVKGHRPSDLVVPWEGSQTAAQPADFDRVGRMWVNWWGVKGKKIEAFTDSSR